MVCNGRFGLALSLCFVVLRASDERLRIPSVAAKRALLHIRFGAGLTILKSRVASIYLIDNTGSPNEGAL